MRVIAGKAKGVRLKAPTAGTRPMTDRMKEAIFSSLGEVDGTTILDLYAGSGQLGLEGVSRGATKATFVENARDAIVKLEANIEATGLGASCEVLWADVQSTLSRGADGERIDLVFVDPPYNTPVTNVRTDLETLVTGGFLAHEGKVVVHRPSKESKLIPLGLELLWERDYGQSKVLVFAHEEEEEEG
ncbi:MAG: rRNA (guanine966-N2)-methyltransferase [Actinomycetota bacterium]|jgi:16S rRNA (guanine966-N2)-methyltransferase|nr:rRNA (guanine966-N2)-methyltransferase [Actinomycetota bacterium]